MTLKENGQDADPAADPNLPQLAVPPDGKLANNIVWFARALRKAGLPIGPGRVQEAVRAVAAAGFTERRDFYWALHAVFVNRPEQRTVFAQVFRLFWRDPRFLEHMMSLMLPALRGAQTDRPPDAGEKRAAEALLDGANRPPPPPPDDTAPDGKIDIDARATMSAEERLRKLMKGNR